jgi:hypothetical protein
MRAAMNAILYLLAFAADRLPVALSAARRPSASLLRRWVVEHTFARFGRNRRLAKDFENLARQTPRCQNRASSI